MFQKRAVSSCDLLTNNDLTYTVSKQVDILKCIFFGISLKDNTHSLKKVFKPKSKSKPLYKWLKLQATNMSVKWKHWQINILSVVLFWHHINFCHVQALFLSSVLVIQNYHYQLPDCMRYRIKLKPLTYFPDKIHDDGTAMGKDDDYTK